MSRHPPPRAGVIVGRIGTPIRHEDESEEKNAQRVVNRLRGIVAAIQEVEEEIWFQFLKSAYYPRQTIEHKDCEDALRRFRAKLSDLNKQLAAVRRTLLRRGAEPIEGGQRTGNLHRPPMLLNYYQTSWLSRLLRITSDQPVITIDDLRVALPELVFRGDSAARMIDFLNHLGVGLDLRVRDKYRASSFIRAIFQYPEPENETTTALLQQLNSSTSKATAARNLILTSHLRIVMRQACSYVGRGLELSDLIQEGCIGLMAGLERFRPEEGTTFRNYVAFWVRQAMLRALANKSRLIRLPVYIQDNFSEAKAVPTDAGAGDFAGAQAAGREFDNGVQVTEAATPSGSDFRVISLYQVSESELHLAMSTSRTDFDSRRGEQMDVTQISGTVNLLLNCLDNRGREVITRRFGLNECRPETLDQIAMDFNLTRERIRQIEVTALKKFRHPSRAGILKRVRQ